MQRATGRAAESTWRFEVDGLAIEITALPTGRWEAVYGGFSKAASDRLEDAIAVAAGANPREPWIRQIAASVLGVPSDADIVFD